MNVLVSSKDIALVGGLGILAFIIFRSGKDLFNALPTLGAGLGETGQGILDFGGQAGSGITSFLSDLNPFSQSTEPQIVQPINPITNPATSPQFPTPVDVALSLGQPLPAITPEEMASDPNINPNLFNPPGVTCFGCPDSPEGIPIIEQIMNQTIPQLPSGFEGGGPSFIGGSIFDTPIANLNLGQIIDKFNVTASQAVNIQAEAQDNFGNFNFGTNTGSGIGGVTTNPGIASQLPGSNVSNSQFAGLSATQIAQLLTGGPINNF